ncbi:MAG: DUF1917 domain-containing protein [Methanomicrobiaceae archaeon]|nr:DUF1917 domain-containing protein [Methanomicrobiaceae archaeon]
MDGAEGDPLADVAYGLFEISLNNALRSRQIHLFELVEGSEDFREDFCRIFRDFESEYPQLAEALRRRFGSVDALYELIQQGEGVVPSCTHLMYWIIQDAPDFRPDESDAEQMGKWLIFLEKEEVDEMWRRIRNATCEGRLGVSAKVSTEKQHPESRDSRGVIYVYTANWEDEAEVMRVREELRKIGVSQRIGYKRNIETFEGEYSDRGKKVTFYSA